MPEIYTAAAEETEFRGGMGACTAIQLAIARLFPSYWEAQVNEYLNTFKDTFMPRNRRLKFYWWDNHHHGDPEARNQRAIALHLMAEIAKDQNKNAKEKAQS